MKVSGWFTRLWDGALRAAPLRIWVLIGAGPVITLCAAVLVWIVWKGDWPVELREKQLSIIGITLFGTLGLLGLVFAKIAGAKARATGPGGTGFEFDAADNPTGLTVATTVTTTKPENEA